MSQTQPQQNPLVPHLVDVQAAAVDAQKKVIAYHENQIKQLNEVIINLRAEKEAAQKESQSLRLELLRLKNASEQKVTEVTDASDAKDNIEETD
jgi:predicted RNase H-like nuclease (RuvC/YqgF family)